MENNTQQKHLYSVCSTDRILKESHSQAVMNDFLKQFINIDKIRMTTYRAGRAVTELIIHYDHDKTFLLTIWEGSFSTPPLSLDDIRLAHKEISLTDIVDIMVLVTRLAHHAQLSPQLSSDSDSAEVLVFSS
ncbi:hypothetical protein KIV40_00075 [Vibrio sp. D173a]|uniref:hypothetical protein n=1 Tax=Vibrio sp. D173a TaxID=2836349 RepID=UPI002557ACCA|nr:hypothetical protein [Vibrio sp. D173a]MDK9753874.1 hypothetical protein [Vibrio sp. D173a]